MTHALSEGFVAESFNVLGFTAAAVKDGNFSITTKSGGLDVQLRFIWNPKHSFYACDVLAPNFRRRVYPRPGEAHLFRGVDARSATTPDLYLVFDSEESTVTDENIADSLKVLFLHGRVVRT